MLKSINTGSKNAGSRIPDNGTNVSPDLPKSQLENYMLNIAEDDIQSKKSE